MRPLVRRHVSKKGSVKRFKRHGKVTKAPNVGAPMRGGWRL